MRPGVREEALCIPCQGDWMMGIVSHGCDPAPESTVQRAVSDLGVVIVVGGPQYRIGSHRLFVRICRELAACGLTGLRFDMRGMGDSTGRPAGFEHVGDDIEAAISALQGAAPHVRRVVLWGLCDGASAALLYRAQREDPRVCGLYLLNPWIRSERSLATVRIQHYYRDRLLSRDFWAKLLTGGVGVRAVGGWMSHALKAMAPSPAAGQWSTWGFQDRMARGLLPRGAGPAPSRGLGTTIALSARDYTAREFETYTKASALWQAALAATAVRTLNLEDADHTLSSSDSAETLIRDLQMWVAG